MIVQNEWTTKTPWRIWQTDSQDRRPPRQSKEAYVQGWLLIAVLTATFLIWLAYHFLGQPGWLLVLPSELQELLRLVEAAGAMTLGLLWFSLLWRRWKQQTAPILQMDVGELQALSPSDFERYVAQLFRQKGYRVTLRGRKGDLGVDLELIKRGGKRAIVQCKRYQNTIGPEIIRELYGTLVHEGAEHAFLVTTAEISKAARDWAQFKPITLIDGQTLVRITAVLTNQPLN